MVHDFDQVGDLLILGRLDEPLPEIALDRHMQHLLLLARQPRRLNFLLHLDELGVAQLHHLRELLRTEEKGRLAELPRQGHLHEFESRNQCKGLSWHSH